VEINSTRIPFGRSKTRYAFLSTLEVMGLGRTSGLGGAPSPLPLEEGAAFFALAALASGSAECGETSRFLFLVLLVFFLGMLMSVIFHTIGRVWKTVMK
jgi:hypothetical protein